MGPRLTEGDENASVQQSLSIQPCPLLVIPSAARNLQFYAPFLENIFETVS